MPKFGYKSAALKQRQSGNAPEIIAYAGRANERLRGKYYKNGSWAEETLQCCQNRCRERTKPLYLGYDDRQYYVRYRSVQAMSRAAKQPHLHRKVS